jgi:hypothetical protein
MLAVLTVSPDNEVSKWRHAMAEQRIDIKASDDELKGRYANALQVSHGREEFFLDFLLIAPIAGQLVGRVTTSPGHMKRIALAIDQQIKLYEKSFGPIDEADDPEKSIGFRTA